MGSFMTLNKFTVSKQPKIQFTDEIRDLIKVFPNANKKIVEDFFKVNGVDKKSKDEITLDISSQSGWEKCSNLHTFFKIDSYNRFCNYFGRDRLKLLSMLMVSGEIKITVENDYKNKGTYTVKPNEIISKYDNETKTEEFFEKFSDLEEISDTMKYKMFKKLGE